jgi:hypothetical protein
MAGKNGKNALPNLKQSEQAKRVNLAEWRASRIHELELPSGLTIKVRDVTMTDLMLTGKLPDSIMSMMTDMAQEGAQEFDLEIITKNTIEWNQMLTALLELCLIEPKIGDQADDEHILLAEIPSDDKLFIFNFLNRGAEALRPFREGEAEPVEAV